MTKLTRISVQGFRSIKDATVDLMPLNVFIGANGAGKSNLINLLQMFNFALSRALQHFIQTRGPASALLHFGPKTTPLLRAELEFKTDTGLNRYRCAMTHAQGDTLIFTHEEAEYHSQDHPQPWIVPLGSGGHPWNSLNYESFCKSILCVRPNAIE